MSLRGRDLKKFLDGLSTESLEDFVYIKSHDKTLGAESPVTGFMRVHASSKGPERIVITDAEYTAG